MEQMKSYGVVKRYEDKDVQLATIEALSLNEAKAIFNVRYHDEKEALLSGEMLLIIETKEPLVFDAAGRVDTTGKSVNSTIRI